MAVAGTIYRDIYTAIYASSIRGRDYISLPLTDAYAATCPP